MRIEEIRERCEATTPGPWEAGENACICTEHDSIGIMGFQKDAEFIAHSREDIPALLDEIDRLTAEFEKYKLALFLTVRVKVMTVGLEKDKTEDEINAMSFETVNAMIEMIDVDKARKIYESALPICCHDTYRQSRTPYFRSVPR